MIKMDGNEKNKCVVCHSECYEHDNDSLFNISGEQWTKIQEHARQWEGLDRYGDVYRVVNWQAGSKGQCVHKSCRLNLSSSKRLSQAKNRKEAEEKKRLQDLQQAGPSGRREMF